MHIPLSGMLGETSVHMCGGIFCVMLVPCIKEREAQVVGGAETILTPFCEDGGMCLDCQQGSFERIGDFLPP